MTALLLILSTVSVHPSSAIRHYLNSYTFLSQNLISSSLMVVFVLNLLAILTMINSILMFAGVYSLVFPWTRWPIAYLILTNQVFTGRDTMFYENIFPLADQFLTSNMDIDPPVLLLHLPGNYYGCENTTQVLSYLISSATNLPRTF